MKKIVMQLEKQNYLLHHTSTPPDHWVDNPAYNPYASAAYNPTGNPIYQPSGYQMLAPQLGGYPTEVNHNSVTKHMNSNYDNPGQYQETTPIKSAWYRLKALSNHTIAQGNQTVAQCYPDAALDRRFCYQNTSDHNNNASQPHRSYHESTTNNHNGLPHDCSPLWHHQHSPIYQKLLRILCPTLGESQQPPTDSIGRQHLTICERTDAEMEETACTTEQRSDFIVGIEDQFSRMSIQDGINSLSSFINPLVNCAASNQMLNILTSPMDNVFCPQRKRTLEENDTQSEVTILNPVEEVHEAASALEELHPSSLLPTKKARLMQNLYSKDEKTIPNEHTNKNKLLYMNRDENQENELENRRADTQANTEESSLTTLKAQNPVHKRHVPIEPEETTTATEDIEHSAKKPRKRKSGLQLCSNITCYIEQVVYSL